MSKFIISNVDEFQPVAIVSAPTKEMALKKFMHQLNPDHLFLEDLHELSINMSFSEKFHYDEESEGQKLLPKKEVDRRVFEYFKEKPEYRDIYLSHWNDASDTDHKMSYFPGEMIMWIWKKELFHGKWTAFKAYDLADLQVI